MKIKPLEFADDIEKIKTLKELVERFKDSDKTAIIDRKEYRKFVYTYKELYELCRKFASFLRESKVKKGDKVIVWSYNGAEYAVILLGAFLEGIIAVPIDLRNNLDFVSKIQKEVKAKIVFQTRYKPRSRIKTVFIEEILDLLKNAKTKSLSEVNGNDVAEIIYTSGTTGKPKGVILTHKNFSSNINALNKVERIKPRFKFLSVLPLSHVFEQMIGLFIPLFNKATIVYIRTLKTKALFEAFSEERITNVAVVPRLLELIHSGILKKVKDEGKEKQFFSILKIAGKLPNSLRRTLFCKIHKKFGKNINYFMCGGATLDKELEEFYNAIGIPLLQGYGLTETSPVLTSNTLRNRRIGSVGALIPGVDIKIDEKEVLAKGDSMTQGYYKNPRQTKELFENGWLRTGDLGYLDKDGFLFLKGRKKDLIVTSAGVNIYPEDLEAVINKMEGVKDSCVIGVNGKIHAVLLLKKGASAKKIIDEANKKLDSSQKIQNYSPWTYEDFPRTTTMKVKKFIVKEAIEKKKHPEVAEKKNKVYAILSQLTKKKITGNSSLQELGLSSIDRVELVSLLEQEFNIEIDEERIVPKTKVKELEEAVKKRELAEEKPVFKKWALSPFVRIIRRISQELIFFPCVWIYSRPKVEGKDNLKDVKGPVIFAANHQSHFDTPLVLMGLPVRYSKRTCAAAWQEFFFNQEMGYKSKGRGILFYLITLFFNIYPLPKEKGVKRSLKYTGNLLDKKWNVLVFPEGERTKTGEMLKFHQGIGMLAVEMKVPIVPVKIEGAFEIMPKWKKLPKFGKARVKIGKPLVIKEDSYIKATELIEKEIKKL